MFRLHVVEPLSLALLSSKMGEQGRETHMVGENHWDAASKKGFEGPRSVRACSWLGRERENPRTRERERHARTGGQSQRRLLLILWSHKN